MQNVGQYRYGDDEHKRISFAVIITITQSLEEEKDNPLGVGALKETRNKQETRNSSKTKSNRPCFVLA